MICSASICFKKLPRLTLRCLNLLCVASIFSNLLQSAPICSIFALIFTGLRSVIVAAAVVFVLDLVPDRVRLIFGTIIVLPLDLLIMRLFLILPFEINVVDLVAGDGSPKRRGHDGPVLRGEEGRRRRASIPRRLRGRGFRATDGLPLGTGGAGADRAIRALEGRPTGIPRGGGRE